MGKRLNTTKEQLKKSLYAYQLKNAEFAVPRMPYAVEQRFFEAIATGNRVITDGDAGAILSYLGIRSEADFRKGTIARNNFKQQEYEAVAFIVKLETTAINAGVDPELAYDTGDIYLQNISMSPGPDEINPLLSYAVLDFFELCTYAREVGRYSIHVAKAIHYIETHPNTPITVDDLAKYTCISNNYLSSVFHRETGLTISEYINRFRIEKAKNMLKYSDISVQAIASYLCYSTQGNFYTVFKRFTGQSPTEYRRANKPINF